MRGLPRRYRAAMLNPFMVLLLGCPTELPQRADVPAVSLARHADTLVSVELPKTNHPDGVPTPEAAVIRVPLERIWGEDGLEQYQVPLPVGQVFYGHSLRVAPAGMELLGPDGEPLRYEAVRTARPEETTWRVRDGLLQLRVARGSAPPPPGALQLRYPRASEWQRDIDPGTSSLEGADYALRAISLDDDVHHGLLLPAPGLARWRITVPTGGVLDMDARILPHAVDQGERSDGARLAVRVHADGEVNELLDRAVTPDDWKTLRVDLDRWAGRNVEIELSSHPGDSPDLDYVFVANPTVFQPCRQPRQVVLVFVDTLRRDHLGLHGYDRPTSPEIDAWARAAVVFDDARATSSWTLPSARALLTGMPQGAWGEVPTLQARLADAGFSTAAYVANAFLTPSFDMGRDWATYSYDLLAPADEQIDRGLEFLDRHADRDAMVMIQLMDPHMPYSEPQAYRERWAGAMPKGLEGKINRRGLRDMKMSAERREAVRRYLVARYDQNLLFVDSELGRLFDKLRDDAVVVLFSDHGEEFFEHGSIEHGHTLYDELLRVPLVIRAPGLAPTRVDTPVSLLDLSPTVLDLLDIPVEEPLLGRTLLPLAAGDDQARSELAARPLFFGGLLYGDEAWGVRSPVGLKWISRGGEQELFDLVSDPGEEADQARKAGVDLTRFPPLLAEALQREVVPLWRITGRGSGRLVRDFDGRVELHHPQGLLRAWHPISLTGDMAHPELEGERVTVRTSEGYQVPREVFVHPAGDALDIEELELTVASGEDSWVQQRSARRREPSLSRAERQTLVVAGDEDTRFRVVLHQAPLPWSGDSEIRAAGGAIDDHLKALGYIDE